MHAAEQQQPLLALGGDPGRMSKVLLLQQPLREHGWGCELQNEMETDTDERSVGCPAGG